MEKSDKKRILTRVLVVLAALTLLSCCFLGSTFARYVTSAGGSGTVGVAKWDITISGDGTGTTAVSFSDLSPDADTGGKGATHSTGYYPIATIANKGEVSASVTFGAASDPTATLASGVTAETEGYNTYYSQANTNSMFSIAFYSDDSGTPLSSGYTLAAGNTLNIYAKVTWTTQSDAMDTWYGENVESVTWTLSYTATQNSELPPAQP